jgi:hypothetical protein
MPYLMIQAAPVVSLGILDALPVEELDWAGCRYVQVAVPDALPAFYDWIRDGSSKIVGLEFFLLPEPADLLRDLTFAIDGSQNGYARINFVPHAVGTPDGTQGFGDIFFYRCGAGQWLIAVGTEMWLKPDDTAWLMELCKIGDMSQA